MTSSPSSRLLPPPARPLLRARRSLFVLGALLAGLLAACGNSDAGDPSGAAGEAGAAGSAAAEPAVGTVEAFSELDFPSEGIVLAADAKGTPALYLGGKSAIWTLTADKTLTRLVDLPEPLGSARTASGDILVCGKLPGDAGKGDMPGAIWRVTPGGKATVQSGGEGQQAYGLPNMIAVAPDESVVFSDSKANLVFHTAADGSSPTVLTDQITYPNGVAFSPDGATLYVASYDTKRIFSLARAADGSFGVPAVFAEGVENVDGISPLASGDLLLVTSGGGVILYGKTGDKKTIGDPKEFVIPSNGAFGAGELGEKWFYVSSLLQKDIRRVYVGQPGATLPGPENAR